MKKSFLLFMVLLIAGTEFGIAQTANNTPVNHPLDWQGGDYYMSYTKSVVVVNGVTYVDGISNYFHNADPGTFRWTKAIPGCPNRGLDPNDIKEIKVLNRTTAELLYDDKGVNGAIIITTKKAGDM